MTRKPAIRMRREADLVYPNPVNNGISGDIRRRHLAPSALSRLNGDILRRWETIASVSGSSSRLSRLAAAPDQDTAGR